MSDRAQSTHQLGRKDTRLSEVVAGQAKSGKWHLVRSEGCLNAGQAAIKSRRAVSVIEDKRNREWCSYCRERLRQLELQAEVNQLRAELNGRRAIDELPDHVALPDIVTAAIESDSIDEAAQELRIPCSQAKTLLHRLALRQFVDGQPVTSAESLPTVESGANHDVESRVDAPDASGWGQRPQGGDQ